MNLKWTATGWQEYLYWQTHDKRVLKRINDLLKDIVRNGHVGIGKPEHLKGDMSDYWSRRIDEKNRLVYLITEDCIEAYSCKGHYDD